MKIQKFSTGLAGVIFFGLCAVKAANQRERGTKRLRAKSSHTRTSSENDRMFWGFREKANSDASMEYGSRTAPEILRHARAVFLSDRVNKRWLEDLENTSDPSPSVSSDSPASD